MRSTAAEEGAIERKTRARRPHAGNLGALERQKSSTFSVYSRPCVVAVELHAAQPVCCGAEVRGEIVLEAHAAHLGPMCVWSREQGRAATSPAELAGGGRMFAIASNFSSTQIATKHDPGRPRLKTEQRGVPIASRQLLLAHPDDVWLSASNV